MCREVALAAILVMALWCSNAHSQPPVKQEVTESGVAAQQLQETDNVSGPPSFSDTSASSPTMNKDSVPDGNQAETAGVVFDNNWFQPPGSSSDDSQEKPKRKCEDFCPLFPFKCQSGQVCVTDENCKMVCRKSDGSVTSLESQSDGESALSGKSGEKTANETSNIFIDFFDESWRERMASLHQEQPSKCQDNFCLMFAHLCKEDEMCVMNKSCKMECRRRDGSQVPLRNQITEAPSTTLRSSSERKCELSGKECIHGTCPDGLHCTCDRGYVGDVCNDLECHFPCTHGVCYLESPTVNKCACQPGWEGVFCHLPACTRKCENEGSCVWDTIGRSSMFCSCKDPWIGKFCERVKPKASNTLALVVGITTPAACLVVLLISWYILWRKRVIFVFKIINMFKAYEDDDDKVYDAYVSLTDADYVFVKHVLQPKLEEMGHRLYLHARDSTAGEVKSEKILEAVEKSRRCIMLLSADYISNEWCRFEYLIAQHETCIKLKQRIIPILIDDIDKDKKKMDKTLRFIVDSVKCLRYPILPPELSDGQYSPIDLGSGHPKSKELATFERRQARFWERLRLSMPKKREPAEVTSPTLSCNSECPLSEHVHYNKKGVRLFLDNLTNYFPFGSDKQTSSVRKFTLASQTSTLSEKAEEKQSVALVSAASIGIPKLDTFYKGVLDNNVREAGSTSVDINKSRDIAEIKTLRIDIPS